MEKNKKIINKITSYIQSNFNKQFNHHKQKILIEDLLDAILYMLKHNTSYRETAKIKGIYYNSIYYFHMKLIKFNVIEHIFKYYVNQYKTVVNNNYIYYTDSTLISNKLGIDNLGYNPQLNKHKSNKISLIIDDYNVPIDVILCKSNTHDAKILDAHIDNIQKIPNMINTNNIIIGDAAYDSNKLRFKCKQLKIGNIYTPKNKRNSKNIKKISANEIMLITKRIKIEHTFAFIKKFKRIQQRYDKYINSYKSFVYLAVFLMFMKNTNVIW